MENKRNEFVEKMSQTGRGIVGAMGKMKEKTIKAIDQNDDGKFDFKDVSEVAGNIGNAVKDTTNAIKESAEARALENERKALNPLFIEDLEAVDFALPKLIRLCERDKRRAESEICSGSIGYITDQKDFKVINMFQDNLEHFDVTFYPDSTYEFYYVDPTDRDRYIALDEYFSYLKVERINELQKIAQDLGAKHFRVTYKEEKASFSSKNFKGHLGAGKIGSVDTESSSSTNTFSNVEIAVEMDCAGHAPLPPKLNYWRNDSSIQNLVQLRMDELAPITHQKYMLKLSNSSGIKESDAIKIDAVLKGFKCAGNASIVNETKNESRRYLEYEIDF